VRNPRLLSTSLIWLLLLTPLAAKLPTRKPLSSKTKCEMEETRCRDKAARCAGVVCRRRVDLCLARKQDRIGETGQWLFRHYSHDRFLALNRTSASASAPRSRLNDSLLARIDSLETSAGAALDGYLLDARQVKRGRGVCTRTGRRPLEIWVGAEPGSAKKTAIRARLTSRILAEHPRWTPARLKPWRSRGDKEAPRIRIRGYLLYNNLKAGEVAAGLRPTAWEVSPVTEILFCPSTWRCGRADEEGWLELDTL